MKGKEQSEAVEGLCGVTIEKIGGSVKRIGPIDRRKTSLKQNGAHNIIKCAKSTLGMTILLRGVLA